MNKIKTKQAAIIAILFVLCGTLFSERMLSEESGVRINEVCLGNLSAVSDSSGHYPDGWIELYNAGPESVNLKGYQLTNQPGQKTKSTLPNVSLQSGEYLVVYVDKDMEQGLTDEETGACYLNYEMKWDSAQTIFLYNDRSELIDELTLPAKMPPDISYGRLDADDMSACGGMACTPWEVNDTDRLALPVLDEPLLSAESGFYAEGFYLTMSAQEGQSIHYTLDGSAPSLESSVYTEPLYINGSELNPNEYAQRRDLSIAEYYVPEEPVDKAVVIRAAAFDREGNCSPAVTETYFIDSAFDSMSVKYGKDIATLSLVADPDDLFGYENGIMVLGETYDDYLAERGEEPDADMEDYDVSANFNNKGREWEREADITYFEGNERRFTQRLGIRTRGKSGSVGPQKSFALYARKLYGASSLQYDIWEQGYGAKRVILKRSDCIMKDGFIMSLVADRALSQTRCQPCFLFINGEFWGTYCAMEKYDGRYFSYYYGIEEDNLAVIKNGMLEEGNSKALDDWYWMLEDAEENDFSIPENYADICQKIDIDSLIDYYVTQIYIDNIDCVENYNMCVWKSINRDFDNPYADGKWHWALYDIDASLNDVARNNISMEISENHPAYLDHPLIHALLQNEEFRERFISRSLDMLRNNFAPEKVLPEFDRAFEKVREALELQHGRFTDGMAGDGVVLEEGGADACFLGTQERVCAEIFAGIFRPV